jgi:hypothetical protein
MNEGRKTTWLHMALLLGALGAGTFTTQFVPAYQEHVGKVTYPSRAASKSDAPSDSQGLSQTENQGPQLTLVRNTK